MVKPSVVKPIPVKAARFGLMACSAVWFFAASAVLCLAAPLPQTEGTERAARDGSGVIWGVSDKNAAVLQRWSGKNWQKTNFSPQPDARVIGLWTRADGSVLALWNQGRDIWKGTSDYCLSSHRGAVSRSLSRFHWLPLFTKIKLDEWNETFEEIESFAAPSGFTYLISQGRDFYRVSESGKTQKLFVLPAKALEKPRLEAGNIASKTTPWAKLGFWADGTGRAWFFHDIWRSNRQSPKLRGLLTCEKGAFTLRRTLLGLPAGAMPPIQALTGDGGDQIFLALRGTGVYRVDARTLRASRVAEPFRGAFGFVRQLWSRGDELYVVAGSPTLEVSDADYTLRRNSLWRRKAGHWKLLVTGLDKDEVQSSRSFLKTSEGLWLGAYGDGLWFIGRDDKPLLVNWQRGFSLSLRQNLFPLQNRAFLCTSYTGTVVVPGVTPLRNQKAAPGLSTFQTYLDPVQDERAHLWAVLNLRDHALHEWDGTRWKKHPVPSNYALSQAWECALDDRGRVWLPSDSRERQAAIFDPQTEKWQVFPTYQAALLANRNGAIPIKDRVSQRAGRGPDQLPRRSHDGRLCYKSAAEKICYFNGKNWQSWKRRDIQKNPPYDYFNDPPFFGKRGQLYVPIGETGYELTPTGWKKSRLETDPDFGARHLNPADSDQIFDARTPRKTISGQSLSIGSCIRDNDGALYLVGNGALYRVPPLLAPRRAHLLLGANQNQPFLDGRSCNQVMSDVRGNMFFNTNDGFSQWVMVVNHEPLPETSIQLQKEASGALSAQFQAPGSKRFDGWFSWRLAGKTWSTPSREKRVSIGFLAPGLHQVEAVAISAAGHLDPTPARAVWTAETEAPQRLQQLVNQLGQPNFAERELAVRALVSQGAIALPLLRASLLEAHKNPADDTAWWLQVTIQEIER